MARILTIALLIITLKATSQVGIGTTTPNASSALEVASTNKGFLPPRLTELQRSSISNPAEGLLVYQTDGNKGYYFFSGSSWINLASQDQSVPTGTVMAFAGSTAPAGWVLCNGAAISRTGANAALFSLINTTYGSGNGSTTFNLPDLRGRVIFGKDDMGGSAANRLTSANGGIAGTTLGASGGAETRTLSVSQIPSHQHYIDIWSSSNGEHTHPYYDRYFAEHEGSWYQDNVFGTSANSDWDNEYRGVWTNTSAAGAHQHATQGWSHAQGGGAAFSVTNPGIVLNYIIKL